ncbi:MAG: hypothetical protein Pg6C_08400 [Treponemataceae bacterium]|nr:MAG: hypothetical protein Pg6C_08400 [Treponemataceae bacterium]
MGKNTPERRRTLALVITLIFGYHRDMVVGNGTRRMMSALFAICANFVFCAEPFIATGISSSAFSSNSARVNWEPPVEAASSFRVYRSTMPIRDTSALNAVNFLGELPGDIKEFVDRGAPTSSFYAVIAVFNGIPFNIVVPSFNATINPPPRAAETGGGTAALPSVRTGTPGPRVFGNRPMPLPVLAPPQIGLPQNTPALSKNAERDVRALIIPSEKNRQSAQRPAPYVFLQEQIPSKSGENFLLYDIVSESFNAGKYADALNRLDELLLVNRGGELSVRAEFYRGECEYFLGNYKTAVRCFMITKAAFPELSSRWLDAALKEIVISQ